MIAMCQESKTCTLCKLDLPLACFYKKLSKLSSRCKECVKIGTREPAEKARRKKYMREYIQSGRARVLIREVYYRRNPHRYNACAAVSRAVIAGALKKPTACEWCGDAGPLEAHHLRGYSPEHWLNVVFICKPCHVSEKA